MILTSFEGMWETEMQNALAEVGTVRPRMPNEACCLCHAKAGEDCANLLAPWSKASRQHWQPENKPPEGEEVEKKE